jgi:hypothetical protein
VLRNLSLHHRRELRASAPALVQALTALTGSVDDLPTAHGPPEMARTRD